VASSSEGNLTSGPLPVEADLILATTAPPEMFTTPSEHGKQLNGKDVKFDRWKFFDPHSMKSHVSAKGEVLFCQPNAGSLSYATESTSTTSILDGDIKSPDFLWNVGGSMERQDFSG